LTRPEWQKKPKKMTSKTGKLMKFDGTAALAHEKQMKKHRDHAHPILLMCQNCGLEGLQSEWVKQGESKQSKPKLTCPRCGSSEHKEME
jgi:DNA-directed RNA polymerase subunit RPC12/RpoP